MPKTEKEEDLPQVQVLSSPYRKGPHIVRAFALVLTLLRVVWIVLVSLRPPSRQAVLFVFSSYVMAQLCTPLLSL